MGRRASRTAKDYFDRTLVETVDRLFKAGARAKIGGKLLFDKGLNNHFRPGKVREIFGLQEAEFSNWKYQDWAKSGADKPTSISDLLIFIFSGPDYATRLRDPERAKSATAVYDHWVEFCAPELAASLEGLRRHHQVLVAHQSRGPLNQAPLLNGASSQPEDSTSRPGPDNGTTAPGVVLRIPPDLTPPPWTDGIPSPHHIRSLQTIARQFFGITIEGQMKSGKSHLAQQYIASVAMESRVLWYNLTSDTVLNDVLSRLSTLPIPLHLSPGQELSNLIEWLDQHDAGTRWLGQGQPSFLFATAAAVRALAWPMSYIDHIVDQNWQPKFA